MNKVGESEEKRKRKKKKRKKNFYVITRPASHHQKDDRGRENDVGCMSASEKSSKSGYNYNSRRGSLEMIIYKYTNTISNEMCHLELVVYQLH